MIYRVIIQPEAQADMESGYGWIAEESPTRAARWYNGLLDAVEGLKQSPQRCGLAPENETFKQEIRQLLYGTYRVLFIISDDTVYVLHVRHGARKQLEPGETDEDGNS